MLTCHATTDNANDEMKCILFGAGGYIGRHLKAAMRTAGHVVMAHGATPQDRVDLSDAHALAALDWDVDCVLLFAGVTGTLASFARFGQFVTGNELALLNVLEAIRATPYRPRVIFPSSRLVYRGSDQALKESDELDAKTVYAANKIACEFQLRAYANAFDVPHTIFRICVPFGNSLGGQYSYGTLGNFIQQATQKRCITLYGDGSLRRTFTHIDDVCDMVILGASRQDVVNETFNLPGDDLSLLEAARCVAERLGANVQTCEWPVMDRRVESGSTAFDGGKWIARTGLAPSRSLSLWAFSIVPHVGA